MTAALDLGNTSMEEAEGTAGAAVIRPESRPRLSGLPAFFPLVVFGPASGVYLWWRSGAEPVLDLIGGRQPGDSLLRG
jgi:hypothetical protein